jgi:ribosomal protein S6--L-glutamate ligase
MYGAVIGSESSPSYTSLCFLKEMKRRNYHAYYLNIDKFACEIRDGDVTVTYAGKPLNKIDFFILRSIGSSLSAEKLEYRINLLHNIEKMGKLVVNPISAFVKARNKFVSLSILASKKIKVPETLITENEFLAYEFIKRNKKCVIKPLMGSRGIGSFLAEDPDIGFRMLSQLKEKGYTLYLQKYINKPNRDLRIIVVGDTIIGAIARESSYWKTNIYQGAKEIKIEVPKELEKLSITINKELGLYYSGIDIAEENNEYYILEVNASPLWHGFQRATGINPAVSIIDLIEKILKT